MSATWEAEKSSSCSIRRLCHIQIGQIILDRKIDLGEHPSNGVYVALRMRGNTRRILRSPEISLVVSKHPSATSNTSSSCSPGAGGYILIDLNCTIQYSHILKMDSNILQVLLQKRKKYKNTTMNLGYKTLAYCNINLSQVLQRRIEHRFLSMYPDPKCIGPAIARIEVHCLSTVPWERDPISPGQKGGFESDGCMDDGCLMPADIFSDDADEESDSEEEVDMDVDVNTGRRVISGISSTSANAPNTERGGQKKVLKSMSVGQIKQKVVSLLKRLKLADPNEEIDTGTTLHLWEEIDKIETVSDVDEDSDIDTGGTGESGSLQSVPRPSIRPFFGHTGSSEETLSLDAGARLLRRLQKEALLAPDPLTSGSIPNRQQQQPPPGTSNLLNEAISIGEGELRRQPTGGRGGVKFSSRFGPIKTRRTVPVAKRRQVTSTPSMPRTATAAIKSSIAAQVQEPLYLNGHQDDKKQNSGFLSPFAEVENVFEPDDYERTEEDSSGSLTQSEMPVFPESLADVQFVVNNLEPGGKVAAAALTQAGCTKLARVSSFAEVRQILSGLVSWAQMHRQVEAIRFCIVGGDALVNAVLRAFVEVAGARSEAVAAAFRFFLVPVSGLVQTYICPCSRQTQLDPQQIHHYIGCKHRRSVSSTLPPLALPSTDLVRPAYPGSPSISRESHIPSSNFRPLTNIIAQRLCTLDSRYSRLFIRLAIGEGIFNVGADVTSNTSTPIRGRRMSTSEKEEYEFVRRVLAYLTSAGCLLSLPIGECLVAGVRNNLPLLGGVGTLSSSSSVNLLPLAFNPPLPMGTASIDGGSSLEEESSNQTLVPFLLCIRLGSEAILSGCLVDSSRRHQQRYFATPRPFDIAMATTGGDHHPPGAPHLTSSRSPPGNVSTSAQSFFAVSAAIGSDKPTYELQLEYWAHNAPTSNSTSGGGNVGGSGISSTLVHSLSLEDRGGVGGGVGGMGAVGGGTDGKVAARPITFKAACRSMVVGLTSSGPLCSADPNFLSQQKPSTLLSLAMVTREKKPKIQVMRIGKKAGKEVTFKPDLTEGVTRLICTCKGVISHTPSGPFADAISDIPRGEFVPSSPNASLLPLTQPAYSSVGTAATNIAVTGETNITASTSSSRHTSASFSLRDDLGCGLVSSEKNSSSSSDQIFIRISIDGVDWPTSRFFQVAPGWRTHVKVFPLVCMSPPSSANPTFALPLAKVMTLGVSSVHPPTSAGVPGASASSQIPL
ncbi:hypothetical protein Aperf_G00000101991 [Anoplocephala perfoliata]